jgi:P-type Cu+ transporter
LPVDNGFLPIKDEQAADVNSANAVCALCGLPLSYSQGIEKVDEKLAFCCPGCHQVYTVLSAVSGALPTDFQKSDIYQACLRSGIIPSPDGKTTPAATESREYDGTISPLEMDFRLDNLWCPACGWLIEEVLRRKKGVLVPRVNFLTDTARVAYRPDMITPDEITSAVRKLGYEVSVGAGDSGRRQQERSLLLRVSISAILSMNGMMLSWTIYSGLFRDLGPTVIAFISYPLLLITAPVLFYGGFPIFRNAWNGIKVMKLSADTLIAISALSAFFYSLAEMTKGSVHLYFDTAAMLITIVLFGRFIEMKARHRVITDAGMDGLGIQKTRLLVDDQERWVATDMVRPGDVFVVRPGERIPLDGKVKKGQGLLDQSVLTGEATPVERTCPDEVLAGSVLVDGEMHVSARRAGKESYLRRMLDITAQAIEAKNKSNDFIDRFSRALVPILLGVTAATGVILRFAGIPAEEILLRCLTMLVVACPCAIGIAVPLVRIALMGSARKRGIVVKNLAALDHMPEIDTVVLDKTGTVTEGRFVYRGLVPDDANENDVLPLLAALEENSAHHLGREIRRQARLFGISAPFTSAVDEIAGRGVTAQVGERKVFFGNRGLLDDLSIPLPSAIDDDAGRQERTGMTTVFFGWGGTVKGFAIFGDALRTDAVEVAEWLRSRGIRLVLLSGDGWRTTEAVARMLGIDNFAGQMMPEEKAERVAALMREGRKVAVVGDGVNDTAALSRASVGIAFGTVHSLTEEVADLALVSGKVAGIKSLFVLGKMSVKAVRQNIALAFLYNVIAIPVAALGLLNPLIAVAAMFASSLTVIGNALRIARRRVDSD